MLYLVCEHIILQVLFASAFFKLAFPPSFLVETSSLFILLAKDRFKKSCSAISEPLISSSSSFINEPTFFLVLLLLLMNL